MTLNPQIQSLLAMFAAMPQIDYATATPEALRAVNNQPLPFGEPPAIGRVLSGQRGTGGQR